MSAPAHAAGRDASASAAAPTRPLSIALLGFGRVGSAVAGLVRSERVTSTHRFSIVGALVRDPSRVREGTSDLVWTADAHRLFAARPDVVVEALGGLEPAATLVRAALEQRLPVVTANKTLVARHGPELLELAGRCGTALRYEASVLAGVPFLGTFAARPLAARISALAGVLNGTSNYILSRVADAGASMADATSEARDLGLAEPDASHDLGGADAADKLAVLAWHFGLGVLAPGAVETTGIETMDGDAFAAARECGGTIKPIAWLARRDDRAYGFVGPALVPHAHRLASVDAAESALQIDTESARLFFAGPGAGPLPTATTILDDVVEAARGSREAPARSRRPLIVSAPATAWLLRIRGGLLPSGEEIAARLGACGVWNRRSFSHGDASWQLTYPCERERLDAGVRSLALGTGCRTLSVRVLEA